jgi:hypothetical protein
MVYGVTVAEAHSRRLRLGHIADRTSYTNLAMVHNGSFDFYLGTIWILGAKTKD